MKDPIVNMQDVTTDTDQIVEIKGISKSFGDSNILTHVELSVKRGENVVVLGKSGSGKSTLIKCMIGLMEPDEGEIIVFGRNIASLSYPELNEVRKKMGFLFQSAALYDSMTVRENLEFPLRHNKHELTNDERNSLVEKVLEQVGLTDAVDKMPAELSGGMSKRIGLARTLILEPAIMLYDEPTTGLDTATAKEISQLILDLQRKNNISSIIITHDMNCAKMTADRIVMLNDGAIVAEGSYETLARSNDGFIQSFFN
ncbi:MAG TPA: ATP-binding cassette domain-containing protein [Puia sp.]|nr:ATP-binding cassette domain-containing protein [Puia sp.]